MISIICAVANNNVIGKDNSLIWHLSSDLKRFKKLTENHTIIMGRKTFESLPGVLPKRKHIIFTRDENFSIDNEAVEISNSIDTIIKNFKDSDEEVFVIGGGQIYTAFLPYASKMYLTELQDSFKGDTYFPQLQASHWKVIEKSEPIVENGTTYRFVDYKRN